MERKEKGKAPVFVSYIPKGNYRRIIEDLSAYEIASSDSGSDEQEAQDAAEITLNTVSLSRSDEQTTQDVAEVTFNADSSLRSDEQAIQDAAEVTFSADSSLRSDEKAIQDTAEVALKADSLLTSNGQAIQDAAEVAFNADSLSRSDGQAIQDAAEVTINADALLRSEGQAIPDVAEVTLNADSLSKVIENKSNTRKHRIESDDINRVDENNATLKSGDSAEFSKHNTDHTDFEDININLCNDISLCQTKPQSDAGDFASVKAQDNNFKIHNNVQIESASISTLNAKTVKWTISLDVKVTCIGKNLDPENVDKPTIEEKDSADASGKNNNSGNVIKVVSNIEEQLEEPLTLKIRTINKLSDAKVVESTCEIKRKRKTVKEKSENNFLRSPILIILIMALIFSALYVLNSAFANSLEKEMSPKSNSDYFFRNRY